MMEILSYSCVFLTLVSTCVGDYQHFSDRVSVSEAVNNCSAIGMELVIASTREKYEALETYLLPLSGTDPFIIGLEWNSAKNSYQWLNGELLGHVSWGPGQPDLSTDYNCVYWINTGYWYTAECRFKYDFICLNTTSDSGYHVGFAKFDVAQQICTDNGGHLPALRTLTDQYNLETLASSIGLGETWLEIAKSGDYFQWIGGNDLEYYFWYNEDRGNYVHIHPQPLQIHAGTIEYIDGYICQTTDYIPVLKSQYHYIRQGTTTVFNEEPRNYSVIVKKTSCAMECSKDLGCYKYTLKESICKTYADVAYTTGSNGSPVWIKVWN